MFAAKPPEKHCCMATSTAFQFLRAINPPKVLLAANAASCAAAAVGPVPVTLFIGSPVTLLSTVLDSTLFWASAVKTKEYWAGDGIGTRLYLLFIGFSESRKIVSG